VQSGSASFTISVTAFPTSVFSLLPADASPNAFGDIVQLGTWAETWLATVKAPLSLRSVASPKVLGLASCVIIHGGCGVGSDPDKCHGGLTEHPGTLCDENADLGSSSAARKEEVIKIVDGRPKKDDKEQA
jgi:hypothetical protein